VNVRGVCGRGSCNPISVKSRPEGERVSPLRDELLAPEVLGTLKEAKVIMEDIAWTTTTVGRIGCWDIGRRWVRWPGT
jgi:hypothetical protein